MNKSIDVLIVEDDVDLGTLLQIILESAGLTTMYAHDGKEGLECALDKQPRLVLTDVLMPRMRGDAMLSQLEETKGKPVPALFLTASSDNPRSTDHPVMSKPFDITKLVSTVNSCLAHTA